MSYSEFDGLSTDELLKLVIIQLRVLTRHIEQITDEEISEEDIDHDY